MSDERTSTAPTRLLRDEDCPACGWGETYAEVDLTAETPGADAHGCSKCGWRTDRGTDCGNCDEPIEWFDREGMIGSPEWVHTRTGGPECKRDGRLIGGYAEPDPVAVSS